jgi:hypothetical protein
MYDAVTATWERTWDTHTHMTAPVGLSSEAYGEEVATVWACL